MPRKPSSGPLDNLRSRPPIDKALVAARKAARLKRDAVDADKRAARIKAQRDAGEVEATAAAANAPDAPVARTEAEKKSARDARYAARKSRQ